MKKLISVIASVMMIASLGVSSVTASADEGVAFEVTKVSTVGEIADGVLVNEETVTVPVVITKNQGSTAFLLEFNHDSAIEVTGISYSNSEYKKAGQFSWNIKALCLLWSENLCQDTTVCGTVAELEFKVPAGTPVGQYEIAFTESEIQLTNSNFDSIEYTLTPGYIAVGGEVTDNPVTTEMPVITETPIITTVIQETPKPKVTTTEAPVTTPKTPTTTTKAPVKATQPKATTTAKVEETTKKPATTTVVKAETSTQKTEQKETVAETVKAIETTVASETSFAEGTLSGIAVAESEEITVTTTISNDEVENSVAKEISSKSSTKVDKTSNSPSTGVASIVVPSVLLAISTGGVVVAAKSKKKK